MTTPFPFTDLQLAVINDLKTTELDQARGHLQKQKGFCCLGRMCEVLGLKSTGYEDHSGVIVYQDITTSDNSYGTLPGDSWKQLYLRSPGGRLAFHHLPEEMKNTLSDDDVGCLWELNDHARWSFKQIGEFIETYPRAVFTNLDAEGTA